MHWFVPEAEDKPSEGDVFQMFEFIIFQQNNISFKHIQYNRSIHQLENYILLEAFAISFHFFYVYNPTLPPTDQYQ